MITVISGTNRPDSRTKLVASFCYEYLTKTSQDEVGFVDLVDINLPLLTDSMYEAGGQHPEISSIQDKYLIPADLWVIVSPEYNGSFPGALKIFIDAVSTRAYKKTFTNKKVSLIGISSGRAGNFRGMEHLTGLFNYLNVLVMPNKLPISSIESLLDDDDNLDAETKDIISDFMTETINFNMMNFSTTNY